MSGSKHVVEAHSGTGSPLIQFPENAKKTLFHSRYSGFPTIGESMVFLNLDTTDHNTTSYFDFLRKLSANLREHCLNLIQTHIRELHMALPKISTICPFKVKIVEIVRLQVFVQFGLYILGQQP